MSGAWVSGGGMSGAWVSGGGMSGAWRMNERRVRE
jgi:hypothetical protein